MEGLEEIAILSMRRALLLKVLSASSWSVLLVLYVEFVIDRIFHPSLIDIKQKTKKLSVTAETCVPIFEIWVCQVPIQLRTMRFAVQMDACMIMNANYMRKRVVVSRNSKYNPIICAMNPK